MVSFIKLRITPNDTIRCHGCMRIFTDTSANHHGERGLPTAITTFLTPQEATHAKSIFIAIENLRKFGWSHKFYQFVLLELTTVHFLYFIFFPSPQKIHLLLDCCTVNAFTLLKYFQPGTESTIRQQVLRTFRLQLAQGLIGNYNSRQRYDSCVRCRRCGKVLCIVNWDSPAEGPFCFEHYHRAVLPTALVYAIISNTLLLS